MTTVLYVTAVLGLLISVFKSKEKTKAALKKAWNSFANIFPQISATLLLIGIILAILTPEQISSVLGDGSGVLGLLFSIMIGAVALIPPYVTYPLASTLMQSGAGYVQVSGLITSLTMVGVLNLPVEIKYFGKKTAFWRNGLGVIHSIFVAVLMGAFFYG